MRTMLVMIALFALGIIVSGFLLGGLDGVSARCSGIIVDFEPCEGARLRQTIFAAALAGSGIVAFAGIVCTVALRAYRNVHTETAEEAQVSETAEQAED